MKNVLKKLGPGFLFAGAAIGVSHLVQSTRAGADFGFGLLWALLLINLVKYPFFEFGPRFASATGKNLIEGYHSLGKGVLIAYFLITFGTMFTIQTAVTIVTAGIASSLFGWGTSIVWVTIITGICFSILLFGRYKLLDGLMKIIVIGLTISTIVAVIFATKSSGAISIEQILPQDTASIAFLIAFMGWMPAPLDISIWHSIWTVEKRKITTVTPQQSKFDFNVGYVTTIILGIGFIALGALVMFESGESFSTNGTEFANQLISMYTYSLGDWAKIIIGVAALTTMFSTTLTTLDASPRVMHKTSELVLNRVFRKGYLFWILVLIAGTLSIFFFFISEMGLLIKIATILSFLTAPFYAIINFVLVNGKEMPSSQRPSRLLNAMSLFGILILLGFGVWYLTTL